MQRNFTIICVVSLLCVLFIISACHNLKDDYQRLIGKKLTLDCISHFPNTRFKIVNYQDRNGCTPCKLQPHKWYSIINELDSIGNIPVILIIESDSLKINESNLPIYYDANNSFFIANDLPSDSRFHCFLLDENNKVILIGNPVQNPKIKELYLRTISERLGIDYNPSSSLDSSEINLGTFSQSESKTAELLVPNNSQSIMQIDSVFTSCECTTASIDKSVINPSGSANLTVKYTPDGVGDFYREVYVQIKGEDKPLVYKIRGKVE